MAQSHMDISNTLAGLGKGQSLKIIELRDSICPKDTQTAEKRTSGVSDVSADTIENATPASLEADLTHYKELFSKLRFSYVEQVTKERFLRALTDDPPLFIEPQENLELEAQLVQAKASLKAQKVEVSELISELEQRGRELSKRHESIRLRTTQLSNLPSQIEQLETTITDLRSSLDANTSTNPSLSLPLPETQALLSTREAELASLNAQLATLQAAVPRKTRELERLEKELQPLEMQKMGTVAAAKEAQRKRERGEAGMGDELEERGRWLRAVERGLRGMLEVVS